ncbi:MAG: hypothetical protein EBR82_84960 [Caulobacteraceae bacterium]|nr:hypothetical protein [Caulobacteraceae bacterium]
MSEQKTMYRAFFGFQSLSMWHPDSPAPHFCSTMELSPCGTYVSVQRRRMDDQGWETVREDISSYWQPTREQALAVAAPRLRQIGERLIRQADELERAAIRQLCDTAEGKG